mmetsp:Transcript_105364/g.187330  ORF Transcript_105364/g.187330 Transcript_105364/m.187330 type:complete len:178 (+) Transcript_105364:81-614(+)
MVLPKPTAPRRFAHVAFCLAATAWFSCPLNRASEPGFSMLSTPRQELRDQRKKTRSTVEGSIEGLGYGLEGHRRSAILGLSSLMLAPAAWARSLDSKIRDAGLDREAGEFRILDINKADIDEYRQFPGMFPTVASFIFKNRPYKALKDVYSKPEFNAAFVPIIRKYEKFLTVDTSDK